MSHIVFPANGGRLSRRAWLKSAGSDHNELQRNPLRREPPPAFPCRDPQRPASGGGWVERSETIEAPLLKDGFRKSSTRPAHNTLDQFCPCRPSPLIHQLIF